MPYQVTLMLIFAGFAALEAWRHGLLNLKGEVKDDLKVELIGGPILLFMTQPLVLFTSAALVGLVFPETKDSLASLPFWAAFGLLILLDDLTQYWWHRLSHTLPWLYNLHRSHHNAEYMSVRMVYRNNVFYYLLMPGLWLSGAMLFMGLGEVYAVFIVAKLTIIIAAHSSVRWDQPLYKIKALHPVMWVVERLISTPTTHAAHHGKHTADGVTNYKGNFGNMLFLWDVIFGTAKITRQVPPAFGVEDLPPVTAAEQLVWPLVRSDNTAITSAPTTVEQSA